LNTFTAKVFGSVTYRVNVRRPGLKNSEKTLTQTERVSHMAYDDLAGTRERLRAEQVLGIGSSQDNKNSRNSELNTGSGLPHDCRRQ
jgi:hypothetical protein